MKRYTKKELIDSLKDLNVTVTDINFYKKKGYIDYVKGTKLYSYTARNKVKKLKEEELERIKNYTTIPEAALILGLSETTVRNYKNSGFLKVIARKGKIDYLDRVELEYFRDNFLYDYDNNNNVFMNIYGVRKYVGSKLKGRTLTEKEALDFIHNNNIKPKIEAKALYWFLVEDINKYL